MPLSTEPETFGESRTFQEIEKYDRLTQFIELAKQEPSYKVGLEHLSKELLPKFQREVHKFQSRRTTIRNKTFKKWLSKQEEFKFWQRKYVTEYASAYMKVFQ